MYQERDIQSVSEKVLMDLVAEGKVPDPKRFDVVTVCSENAVDSMSRP